MNAEILLNHFDRICEAPDAIPKLRQLVLDLAVRGKLVKRNVTDEPVSALIVRISTARRQLSETGKLRTGVDMLSKHVVEPPYPIPLGWQWLPLGSIVFSRDSDRIPVSSEGRASRAKKYDYYGASGVIDRIDDYLFDKPLLLIGEDGANLINRSTPIAFIARGKYWVNNHAHVLDAVSEPFLRYIELYVNATDLKPYITGAAQPKLNQARMNSIPVAVPPEAEQHRIVAKVDELMALIGRLEEAQKDREQKRDWLSAASLHRLNAPAEDAAEFKEHVQFHLNHLPRMTVREEQIKELRKTILGLACAGRIVPTEAEIARNEGRSYESTEGLLARITIQRVTQSEGMLNAGRPHRQRAPEKAEKGPSDPNISVSAALPDGWRWTTLAHVADIQGGIQKQPSRVPLNNPYPFLRVANVGRGRLDLREIHRIELFSDEILKLRLLTDDLLIVEGNGSPTEIGRMARWLGQIDNCVHQNHIIRARPILALSNYIEAYWNSPAGSTRVAAQARSSTGLHTLSVSKVSDVPIPLPPLAEQHRIVAKADELMALCDRLEAQIIEGHEVSGTLLEAVMNTRHLQAFDSHQPR